MVSVTAEQHVSVPLLRASWEALTFVHWRVEPERMQALLPRRLKVDVYDGTAWVGLTPFMMANMRPLGIPHLTAGGSMPGAKTLRLPDVSSTPETNLRTYVRGPDGRDGLWFLTIDVGNAAVAAALRAAVGAPYHNAGMSVERHGDTVTYTGARSAGDESYRVQVLAREKKVVPTDLEVWLTGRWRVYTAHLGRLLVTPVEHEPWPLRQASLESLQQNLTTSVGLEEFSQSPLVHFSDGVNNVRVGRPALLPSR